MSDLRDKIARALWEFEGTPGAHGFESPPVSVYHDMADTVLAVLDLEWREYAIARPASMPDMSGKERFTLIVGSTFPTREQAENARRRVPALRGVPTLIVSRIAPGSDWEEER